MESCGTILGISYLKPRPMTWLILHGLFCFPCPFLLFSNPFCCPLPNVRELCWKYERLALCQSWKALNSHGNIIPQFSCQLDPLTLTFPVPQPLAVLKLLLWTLLLLSPFAAFFHLGPSQVTHLGVLTLKSYSLLLVCFIELNMIALLGPLFLMDDYLSPINAASNFCQKSNKHSDDNLIQNLCNCISIKFGKGKIL